MEQKLLEKLERLAIFASQKLTDASSKSYKEYWKGYATAVADISDIITNG